MKTNGARCTLKVSVLLNRLSSRHAALTRTCPFACDLSENRPLLGSSMVAFACSTTHPLELVSCCWTSCRQPRTHYFDHLLSVQVDRIFASPPSHRPHSKKHRVESLQQDFTVEVKPMFSKHSPVRRLGRRRTAYLWLLPLKETSSPNNGASAASTPSTDMSQTTNLTTRVLRAQVSKLSVWACLNESSPMFYKQASDLLKQISTTWR